MGVTLKETDRLILGTAGLGGIWGKIDPEESVLTVLTALQHGIPAIDTAPAYGDAEQIVGLALSQWAGEKPEISTKVGRMKGHKADEANYDYTLEGMKRSVENSLKTLNISSIDLLFLHDPAAITLSETGRVLRQMQLFKQHGYAKKIGLGGNAPEWFGPYIKAGQFDVVMEYNRLNACCINALDTAIPICEENDMEYYAASPLNMGLLGCNFSSFTEFPPDWMDPKSITQAKKINLIALKYNMPLQVLAHRFLLTIPSGFKIVIGASDRSQLEDTLRTMKAGALPPAIYNEIIQILNHQ